MTNSTEDFYNTIKISSEAFIAGAIKMEPYSRLGQVEVYPGCSIGMHSYMVSGIIRSFSSIGRYCSIGRLVNIGTGEHNLEALSTGGPIALKCAKVINTFAREKDNIRTVIENDVWIGDKATIFSGVTVGTGAVIGASAVVTKDVPPYSIVIGVPAHVQRHRFDQDLSQRLLASKWWNYNVDDLITLDPSEIETFLDRLEVSGLRPVFEKAQHLTIGKKNGGYLYLKAQIALQNEKIKRLSMELEDIKNLYCSSD